MLVPSLITRSIVVLSETNGTYKLSTSFIAKFADGSEKVLNQISKVKKDLVQTCELGEFVLIPSDCPLYLRDWSKVTFTKNNFSKEYPKQVLPEFIYNYIYV